MVGTEIKSMSTILAQDGWPFRLVPGSKYDCCDNISLRQLNVSWGTCYGPIFHTRPSLPLDLSIPHVEKAYIQKFDGNWDSRKMIEEEVFWTLNDLDLTYSSKLLVYILLASKPRNLCPSGDVTSLLLTNLNPDTFMSIFTPPIPLSRLQPIIYVWLAHTIVCKFVFYAYNKYKV